ncbi:MAG TPA: DUF3466 family protein, partial [Permianibacter sp.]|nr:DUF3466 family protein [Permianibacter sp.]
MNKLFLFTTLLVATTAGVSAQPVAKKYEIRALPTFCDPARPDDESKCGRSTYAYAMNNNGVVVGFSQSPLVVDVNDLDDDEDTAEEIRPFKHHGFRWQSDSLSLLDMGDLGHGESQAFAINDHGVAVGRANFVITGGGDDNQTVQYRAFISDSSNTMTVVSSPAQTTRLSSATGISDDGHVVGYAEAQAVSGNDTFYTRGWIKFPGVDTPTLIPSLQSDSASVLRAVNSTANATVGYAIKDGVQRSIKVVLSSPTTLIELPDLGGSASIANAINNDGVVVGGSQVVGDAHSEGYIYDPSASPSVRSIGLLNDEFGFSLANDINNEGLIVGTAVAGLRPTLYHAVAFDSADSAAELIDLNSRIDCASDLADRWTLTDAYAVNDSGQIIGFGAQGSVAKAFILTPLGDDAAAPIPCASIDDGFENQSGGGAFMLPFLPLL